MKQSTPTGGLAPRSWGTGVLLGALSMVSAFSIDTFFPSFRAISAEFGLNAWQIQQTLTVYMIPYAIMALAHGPLSDAFGRKPVILAGLSIYALASVACALTPNFELLLIFRALQGATAGVGFIVGRAIIRDLHTGAQAQRLMSLVTMVFGLAPAIAPVIGGFIHVAFGWRAVFAFMAVIGISLLTASSLRLTETHHHDRRVNFHVLALIHTSGGILRHSEFVRLALAQGINFAGILSFVAAAPAIVLDHWHLRETQFAALLLPLIAGFTSGAAIAGRLAGRVTAERVITLGFCVALMGMSLLVLVYFSGLQSIPVEELLLAVTATGLQLMTPSIVIRMLDLFPNARGAAASVQSFVSLSLTAFAMGVLAPALQHSLLALATATLIGHVTAASLWLSVRKRTVPDARVIEA